jgi:pimeloyl-ACP methyl ester carboxylesterase
MASSSDLAASVPGKRNVVQLNGRSWGTQGAQRLVLVHGFSCSSRWWDPVGRLLQGRYSLLSVDLLGHGDSPRSPFGYSIGFQAEALVDALERYGVTGAILVGHSMGGHICTEAAMRDPERVAGTIVVDTPPQLPGGDIGPLARFALLPGIGTVARMAAPPVAARRGMAGLFAPGFTVPAELVGDARRMARDSYASSWRGMLQYMQSQGSVGARLGMVNAPKLVMWGELDRLWPLASGRDLADRAGAEFVTVTGSGHSPQIEAPKRVAAAIERFAGSLNSKAVA